MNNLLKVKFESLLTRRDVETIMTSQNMYKVSSTIATKIFMHVKSNYFTMHYQLLISKLFADSLDSLNEDAIELLNMKYGEKLEAFQNKEHINTYLQEVKLLCEAESETTESSSVSTSDIDIFTTEEEPKEKKTFKEIKKEVLKPTKKKLCKKEDEEVLVENIKKSRQTEEYNAIEFNNDDNDKINKIFFD